MKILLIDPPFYRLMGFCNRYFPLGLAYLSSYLKVTGHEVGIYNSDFHPKPSKINYSLLPESYDLYLSALKDDAHPAFKEILDVIRGYKPDAVGITAMTPKMASVFRISALVKKENPRIILIVGGNHPTIKPVEVMSNSTNIDGIVIGEGEISFSALVQCLSEGKTPDGIEGVSYRVNGIPVHGKPVPLIEDLDSLPFPTREFIKNNTMTSEDLGLLLTSRGCPYGCHYCSAKSLWGRMIRFRSIDNVMSEVDFIFEKYNVRHLTIKDDIFTVDRNRVRNFCIRLIDKKMKLTWECNSRADLIDEETLKLMRRSGCNAIKIGIEAGDENTLRRLNKNITTERIYKAARILRKSKIHWTGYFMMGTPGQRTEKVEQTLKFMKKIKPDFASISVCENYPGTELFEFAKKTNIVKDEMTLAEFYNTPPNQYYLKERDKFSDVIDKTSFKELEIKIKSGFHKYNRSLFRILRRISSRKRLYFRDLRVFLRDIRLFAAWYKG